MEKQNSNSTEHLTKRFDVAIQTRNFEIGLFWQRSLFFWGFIAAAFVAIAALKDEQPTLSLLVSGFAIVCSLAWTLANRGSKYWQEQWESKIESVENQVTGPLFKQREHPQDKGLWLSGRKYSVSKLTIAVSDYVFVVWAGIFFRQASKCLLVHRGEIFKQIAIWATIGFTVFYSVLILIYGRSRGPALTIASQDAEVTTDQLSKKDQVQKPAAVSAVDTHK